MGDNAVAHCESGERASGPTNKETAEEEEPTGLDIKWRILLLCLGVISFIPIEGLKFDLFGSTPEINWPLSLFLIFATLWLAYLVVIWGCYCLYVIVVRYFFYYIYLIIFRYVLYNIFFWIFEVWFVYSLPPPYSGARYIHMTEPAAYNSKVCLIGAGDLENNVPQLARAYTFEDLDDIVQLASQEEGCYWLGGRAAQENPEEERCWFWVSSNGDINLSDPIEDTIQHYGWDYFQPTSNIDDNVVAFRTKRHWEFGELFNSAVGWVSLEGSQHNCSAICEVPGAARLSGAKLERMRVVNSAKRRRGNG